MLLSPEKLVDQDVKNMHAYKREFNAVIGPASRNGKQSK